MDARTLHLVGDVALGVHQKFARQADNPFIWPATGCWRQLGGSGVGDVYADDSEVATFKFPNIRATATADRLCTILVRIGAKPAKKHGLRIHADTTIGEYQNKCKKKIPAIAGLCLVQASARLLNVAPYPANRKSLGQAIRNYRKKSKMTQERLGELADLNPKYIGEVERMEKTISVDALARIATALKVRLRDLVRDA